MLRHGGFGIDAERSRSRSLIWIRMKSFGLRAPPPGLSFPAETFKSDGGQQCGCWEDGKELYMPREARVFLEFWGVNYPGSSFGRGLLLWMRDEPVGELFV